MFGEGQITIPTEKEPTLKKAALSDNEKDRAAANQARINHEYEVAAQMQ